MPSSTKLKRGPTLLQPRSSKKLASIAKNDRFPDATAGQFRVLEDSCSGPNDYLSYQATFAALDELRIAEPKDMPVETLDVPGSDLDNLFWKSRLDRLQMLQKLVASEKSSAQGQPTEAEMKLQDEICTLNLMTNLNKVLF